MQAGYWGHVPHRTESGSISVGDTVTLTRVDGGTREVTAEGIEAFRKVLKTANAGDVAGLLFKHLGRPDLDHAFVGKDDVLSR